MQQLNKHLELSKDIRGLLLNETVSVEVFTQFKRIIKHLQALQPITALELQKLSTKVDSSKSPEESIIEFVRLVEQKHGII